MRNAKQPIKEWIFIFTLTTILCSVGLYIYSNNRTRVFTAVKTTVLYIDKGPHEESFRSVNKYSDTIPSPYLYRMGHLHALKKHLSEKNSLLAEEPYFGEIIKQSRIHNLNPCLLFAITGREQSFVPKNNKFASKISNNPFNVYGSWKNYNTTIEDSAKIACRSIISLSKSRPSNIEFIQWINTRGGEGGYAEDGEWHKDVKTFFDFLNTKVY